MAFIVTNEKAEQNLNDERNLLMMLTSINYSGNGVGSSGAGRKVIGANIILPDEVKAAIGGLSKVHNVKSVADEFILSKMTVSHAAKGISRESEGVKPELVEKVRDVAEAAEAPIRLRALDRIRKCIDVLTDQKLEDASLKDVNTTAKTMAAVFEKLGPRIENGVIQFNVFVPGIKKESDYQTIDVTAKKIE